MERTQDYQKKSNFCLLMGAPKGMIMTFVEDCLHFSSRVGIFVEACLSLASGFCFVSDLLMTTSGMGTTVRGDSEYA